MAHTSSLPRLPDNLQATIKDEANPYANYTVENLYAFLSSYELRRPIDSCMRQARTHGRSQRNAAKIQAKPHELPFKGTP